MGVIHMEINDRYSAAGITLDPEHFTLRSDALAQLRGNLKSEQILDLAEYLFELIEAPTDGWLAEALKEHDPTFSTLTNAREIRLLSAQMLDNEMCNHNALAGLVVLTGEAMKLRRSLDIGSLPEHVEALISKYSSSIRNQSIKNLKEPGKVEENQEIKENIDLTKTPNQPQAVNNALEGIYDRALQSHPALIRQHNAIKILSESIRYMREQSDLLWWHISEWSEIAGRSHTQLNEIQAAVLLPFDAANITVASPGPVALPALFKRALRQRATKLKAKKKIKLIEIIEALDAPLLEKLPLPENAIRSPGLFPLLHAFKSGKDVGTEGQWIKPFENKTSLSVNASVSTEDVAVQISRELDALNLV